MASMGDSKSPRQSSNLCSPARYFLCYNQLMNPSISYTLPVTIFREGDAFVAHTPALDLSSVGKSEEDAKRMFAEAVGVFFEELIEMGTMESVLKDLGWTQSNGKFQPPHVVEQSLMNVIVPSFA